MKMGKKKRRRENGTPQMKRKNSDYDVEGGKWKGKGTQKKRVNTKMTTTYEP